MTKKKVLLETRKFLNLYYKTGDMYRFLILTKSIRPLRIDLPYYRYRIGALKFLRYYLGLSILCGALTLQSPIISQVIPQLILA